MGCAPVRGWHRQEEDAGAAHYRQGVSCLSATGGCVLVPSKARDEPRVAEVQMCGAEARRDEYSAALSG